MSAEPVYAHRLNCGHYQSTSVSPAAGQEWCPMCRAYVGFSVVKLRGPLPAAVPENSE